MYDVSYIRRIPATILLCFALTLIGVSQITEKNDLLRNLVGKNGQAEVTIVYPGPAETEYISRNLSIRSVKGKTVSIVITPLTLEWFISRGYDYSVTERNVKTDLSTSPDLEKALSWDTYPTYTQYDSIMRLFISDYPSLCRLDTIGKTIEGRLVLALKISDNCSYDEDEPKVFYTSSMHGDETGGFILMMRLCEYLLKNYGTDSRVKDLVDNLEIWINPLANPDGTYKGGNEINMPVRGNANGYDLNRNFPDPSMPGIVIQKETLDMMKFMMKHRFVLSANFHSGSEIVNYPWDRWVRDHADKNWFYGVSRAYADTAHVYSPPGYMDYLDNGVTNGYRWYPVYGSRQDYETYELHGRELTIEIDEDYITPAYNLEELWQSNRRSLIGYLSEALFGIHGHVVDSETGKAVAAKITIAGHDKDNSEALSDTATGRFVRLIEPGSWDLSFTARGYKDNIVKGISVIKGQASDITVRMDPDSSTPDTSAIAKPLLYPNPSTGIIKAEFPGKAAGKFNIRIFNSAGMLLSDYDAEVVDGTPLCIDISSFSAGMYFIRFTKSSEGLTYRSRFIVTR